MLFFFSVIANFNSFRPLIPVRLWSIGILSIPFCHFLIITSDSCCLSISVNKRYHLVYFILTFFIHPHYRFSSVKNILLLRIGSRGIWEIVFLLNWCSSIVFPFTGSLFLKSKYTQKFNVTRFRSRDIAPTGVEI